MRWWLITPYRCVCTGKGTQTVLLLSPGSRPLYTMLFRYYFMLETHYLTLQTKYFIFSLFRFLVKFRNYFQGFFLSRKQIATSFLSCCWAAPNDPIEKCSPSLVKWESWCCEHRTLSESWLEQEPPGPWSPEIKCSLRKAARAGNGAGAETAVPGRAEEGSAGGNGRCLLFCTAWSWHCRKGVEEVDF